MPHGSVTVSATREGLMAALPKDIYQVHAEGQRIEHSIEAIMRLLGYYNKDMDIVPIVAPYMSFAPPLWRESRSLSGTPL